MVKVSITLPDNTNITFESDDPELARDIAQMALQDITRDPRPALTDSAPPTPVELPQEKGTAAPVASAPPEPAAPHSEEPPGAIIDTADTPSEDQRLAFTAFCHLANPTGDMRRVVAVTEGAVSILNMDGVDADDLGVLFDLVGWRRPANFTQTLRNAARAKFGWLERIPGRTGRYAVTHLGRAVILSE